MPGSSSRHFGVENVGHGQGPSASRQDHGGPTSSLHGAQVIHGSATGLIQHLSALPLSDSSPTSGTDGSASDHPYAPRLSISESSSSCGVDSSVINHSAGTLRAPLRSLPGNVGPNSLGNRPSTPQHLESVSLCGNDGSVMRHPSAPQQSSSESSSPLGVDHRLIEPLVAALSPPLGLSSGHNDSCIGNRPSTPQRPISRSLCDIDGSVIHDIHDNIDSCSHRDGNSHDIPTRPVSVDIDRGCPSTIFRSAVD